MASPIYNQWALDSYIAQLHELYAVERNDDGTRSAENLLEIQACEATIKVCMASMDEQVTLKREQTTVRLENELKEAFALVDKKQEQINMASRELQNYEDIIYSMKTTYIGRPTATTGDPQIVELENLQKMAKKEYTRAKFEAMYVLLKKNTHAAHCAFHTMAKLVGLSREEITVASGRAPTHPMPSAMDFQYLMKYWNNQTDQLVERFYRGF